MPETVISVIGRYLKEFREERHLTRESIALAARPFGVSWGDSKITRIEAGEGSLGLDELLVLLEAMRRAARIPVKIGDIFPDNVAMTIGIVPIDGRELKAVLRGENEWLAPRQIGFGLSEALDAPRTATTRSTSRAAKKLGMTASELEEQSMRLWGMSFDEAVREHTEGNSPQSAGHATRRVILELGTPIESVPNVVRRIEDARQRGESSPISFAAEGNNETPSPFDDGEPGDGV